LLINNVRCKDKGGGKYFVKYLGSIFFVVMFKWFAVREL